jgi:hypothetical protein
MPTYVLRNGEFVEKSKAPPPETKSVHVISDVQPFISPIDRSLISSRSQIREHERIHGVKQVGNDITPPHKEN